MNITVRCGCGKKIRAKQSKAGKTFACPACGAYNTVPHVNEESSGGYALASESTAVSGIAALSAMVEEENAAIAERRAASVAGSTPDRSTRPAAAPARKEAASGGGGSTLIPTLLAATALVVALLAAARSFLHDPLGKGLEAYDLTSPQMAMLAQMKMDLNGDIRAALQMQRLQTGTAAKEKMDTLEVHQEINYNGIYILFVLYHEGGVEQHDILAFEEHPQTGQWLPAHLITSDFEDSNLERQIVNWRDSGGRIVETDETTTEPGLDET